MNKKEKVEQNRNPHKFKDFWKQHKEEILFYMEMNQILNEALKKWKEYEIALDYASK